MQGALFQKYYESSQRGRQSKTKCFLYERASLNIRQHQFPINSLIHRFQNTSPPHNPPQLDHEIPPNVFSKCYLLKRDFPFIVLYGTPFQGHKKSKLSGRQNITRKNFLDRVRKSFSRQKCAKSVQIVLRHKCAQKCINCFCIHAM